MTFRNSELSDGAEHMMKRVEVSKSVMRWDASEVSCDVDCVSTVWK